MCMCVNVHTHCVFVCTRVREHVCTCVCAPLCIKPASGIFSVGYWDCLPLPRPASPNHCPPATVTAWGSPQPTTQGPKGVTSASCTLAPAPVQLFRARGKAGDCERTCIPGPGEGPHSSENVTASILSSETNDPRASDGNEGALVCMCMCVTACLWLCVCICVPLCVCLCVYL